LRSYPAKLYYQIDEINHQQKKDKGRRLIMRNVFLPPKKKQPEFTGIQWMKEYSTATVASFYFLG
jgi:hypothetical protein